MLTIELNMRGKISQKEIEKNSDPISGEIHQKSFTKGLLKVSAHFKNNNTNL